MLQAVIDGAAVVVPAIWKLEVVNTLVVAERRKKVAPEKSAAFVRNLQKFTITVDFEGIDQVFSTVLDQARLYQRTAYDGLVSGTCQAPGPSPCDKRPTSREGGPGTRHFALSGP